MKIALVLLWSLAGARRALKEPHDGKPLSDHLGLEAHYLFAKPVAP